MSKKKQLGQYFSTNYNYIFTDFFFIDRIKEELKIPDIQIVEPFAGECDLIKYLKNNYNELFSYMNVKAFDIDVKNNDIDILVEENDSLENPPYNDSNIFVITNPPYLASNKSKDKLARFIYEKYNQDDLYKCFIETLINSEIIGASIIIPLNFLSSIRKKDIDLRLRFFKKFNIDIVNIFEESVFEDTKYSVCSMQLFSKTANIKTINESIINIFTDSKKYKSFNFDFNKLNYSNNAMIGGDIYNTDIYTLDTDIFINRLTKKNENEFGITRIYVKCLDDNKKNKIGMRYLEEDEELYIDRTDNLSARCFMTLIIRKTDCSLDKTKQKILIEKFNLFINTNRDKYNSLFLTNYRESSDIARKRISFSLVYNICNHIIQKNNLI